MGEPKGYLIVPVGFDPDGKLRSLELDADDNLKVAFAEAAKGLVGPHGWIGGAWQKNPLLLGFSGQASDYVEDLSLSAGTNTFFTTAVPAGEVHVITSVAGRYNGTTATNLRLRHDLAAITVVVKDVPTPPSGVWQIFSGSLTLVEGDKIAIIIVGATAGEEGRLAIEGYRMDIDQ